MTMPQVRPSRLPLAHECPSSLLPAEHPLGGGSEASDIGQAQHYAAGALVLEKPYDVVAVARSFSVDIDELAILMAQTAKIWRYLQRWFPSPRVEYRLSSELLGGGTADVVHHDGDTAAVNDWKSGRVQRNYRWQLWGYAYDLRETLGMPRSGVIDSATSWVRTGDVEQHGFTERELDAMADEHRALESKLGEVYAPGEHCGFCPRRHKCGAYTAALRATTTALAPIGKAIETGSPTGLTVDDLVRAYPQAKLLEDLLAAYRELLKAGLADGARLPVGDGRVLYLADIQRTKLDPALAMEALRGLGWSECDIASCLDLHKSRAEELAAERGRSTKQRGAIKAAKEELMTALEQAGAVSKVVQQRLTAAKEK
jgi:hypothetical protein